MELDEKIVKYGTFVWKFGIPDGDQDDEQDNGHVVNGIKVRSKIVTVIRCETNPAKSISVRWVSLTDPRLVNDPYGKNGKNFKAYISCYNLPSVSLTGFLIVRLIDQEGKIIPGQFKMVCLNKGWFLFENGRSPIHFKNLEISENSEDRYFVCFEMYIAVDEIHKSYLNRSTNDLSLLLDESLLTDSVLRVSGREIMVHCVILAARWPRFYEKFLDGSKDSVVDVAEFEPEVFEKLLECVYSNRIPISLFRDAGYKHLTKSLKQTKLLEHIQTVEQLNSPEPPANNLLGNVDELHESDSNHYNSEIEIIANHESITYRSFTYSTVVTKENYIQSTTSLDSTLKTVFPGELGMIVAIWEISWKKYDEQNDYNYCRLKLLALENSSSVRARTRLCIFNSDHEKQFEFEKIDQYDIYSEVKYPIDSRTMKTLGKRFLIDHLLDDDELTICLNMDIQISDLAGKSIANLTDDLGRLLVDDHLSDVVLRVKEQKFPVHRAILAARSPVFRAMFTSKMKESVAKEIPIEDMEPDVMKEFLRCVYTDQVPVECGCDIMIAFDRFGLISLLDRCQDSVSITVENALEFFAVAKQLDAKRLKMRILKFLTNREMRTQGTMTKTA